MRTLLILLFCVPQIVLGQSSKADSVWLPFHKFIGTWTGSGEGADGNGVYERSYNFVLNKRFIEIRNKTTYSPNPKNTKGYTHEDVGYFSFDNTRKKFVLRQFHAEGFVNQFILEKISADGRTFTFVTESIENIPAGWRARETYIFSPSGELTEVFDLAEPDKDFVLYSKALLRKK